MTLTLVTFLMIVGRCTILIYLVFCVPILTTILYFIFKNDTSVSSPNRELFFKDFHFGGHRGSPERAPENTIASFEKAKDDGCNLVEFDIHMSIDGVPLIMHDDTTERTGNCNLKVEKTTWEVLEAVDLKPVNNVTAKIPKLNETIDWCIENGMKMLFDMKNDNLKLIEIVAEEIRKRNIYDKVMVSSFNPVVPWRLKKIDPKIITGITLDRSYYSYSDDHRQSPFSTNIFTHFWNEILDEINMIIQPLYILPKFLGVDVVMLSFRLISENAIRESNEKGFSVLSWTVNDEDYMRILAKQKVPFLTDISSKVDQKIFKTK
ncbi:hypothetical protein CAEBREN_04478 [Caenorhabditis brenneri]|uniref:GP-PDE domain-containing protein n=1 Tax=Caenorhabditis brenneri TaxID=135651 RepID=G0MP43_CAEBE|nr:hypothetical protein CAEBREN_04478 [Caenorhabditis brenneri]